MHISLNNHAENVIIEHGQCLYTYPASLDVGNYIVTWALFDIDDDTEEIEQTSINGDENNGSE